MIKVNQKELLKVLKILKDAVSKSGYRPLLEDVYLRVLGNELSLKTSNLYVCMELRVENHTYDYSEIEMPINFNSFFECIKALDSGMITIENDKNECNYKISDGVNSFCIHAHNHESPDLVLGGDEIFDINADDLLRAVNLTAFATAKKDKGYTLSCMLFEIENNILKVVATDSDRLSVYDNKIICDKDYKFFIPKKAIKPLKNFLKYNTLELIHVQRRDNYLILKTGNNRMGIELADGYFPRYKDSVLALKSVVNVMVPRKKLLFALKKAIKVVKSKFINLMLKNNVLRVYYDCEIEGKIDVPIDVKADVNIEMNMIMNPKVLVDMLREYNREFITIKMQEENSPIYIKDCEYTYIAMPMTHS